MEVHQKLHVGAIEFFDALAASVAYDISQAMGKKVKPDQIYSGYRYKKNMKNKMRQEGEVSVLVKQFSPPSCYEARFRSSQGTNFIHYQIDDMEDGTIMVVYREGFEGENVSKSLNYKLVSWLYSWRARKRISRMLKSMEDFIQQKKGKEE